MSGLRFAAPTYSALASLLLDTDGLESCAIGYAHHDPASGSWIVADAAIVPDDAYERRDCVSAVLKPGFLIDVANRSRITAMAVVAIHTHPGSRGNPHFSATDDDGEAELTSYLGRRGAPVPHVALVIGPEGARALRADHQCDVGHRRAASAEIGREFGLTVVIRRGEVRVAGVGGGREARPPLATCGRGRSRS